MGLCGNERAKRSLNGMLGATLWQRQRREQEEQENAKEKHEHVLKLELVDDTIFIQPAFINNCLHNLFQSDRNVLISFFGQMEDSDEKTAWLRYVCCLAVHVILHKCLVPFVFPQLLTTDLSKSFWQFEKKRAGKDAPLRMDEASWSQVDYERVMMLLIRLDIMLVISEHEYMVSSLLGDSQKYRVHAAFPGVSFSAEHTWIFNGMPCVFFFQLTVKSTQHYLRVDFSYNTAPSFLHPDSTWCLLGTRSNAIYVGADLSLEFPWKFRHLHKDR